MIEIHPNPLNHFALASAPHSSGGWSLVRDTGQSEDRHGCYVFGWCCFLRFPTHTRCAHTAGLASAPSPSAAAAPAGLNE